MSAPEMNETQRKLARHALGLPNSMRRSYRNRYHSNRQGEAFNAWLGLKERGLAVQDDDHSYAVFYLTQVGAETALEPGETLDPEDFPARSTP